MLLRPGEEVLDEPAFRLSARFRSLISSSAVRQWVMRSGSSCAREALKIDPARHAGSFPELHLAGVSRAGLQDLLAMALEGVLILRCNEASEGLPDQLLPVDAESVAALRLASTIVPDISSVRWPAGEKS